jgi:hypothetical protein
VPKLLLFSVMESSLEEKEVLYKKFENELVIDFGGTFLNLRIKFERPVSALL